MNRLERAKYLRLAAAREARRGFYFQADKFLDLALKLEKAEEAEKKSESHNSGNG